MKTIEHTFRIGEMEQTSSAFHAHAGCTENEFWIAADRFIKWLDDSGYGSYDPYDIWGTRYGRLARRLYYGKHPAGVVMTAPLVLMEVICPRLRGLFVKKDRYPTADAQLALAFLNLYEASQNQRAASDDHPLKTR